jgi:hypothetical protein
MVSQHQQRLHCHIDHKVISSSRSLNLKNSLTTHNKHRHEVIGVWEIESLAVGEGAWLSFAIDDSDAASLQRVQVSAQTSNVHPAVVANAWIQTD